MYEPFFPAHGMAVRTPAGGGSGWTVAEPPTWCRDDLLVLLELVPERPTWLAHGPPPELEEALGIALWRAVANVRLWAETGSAARGALFLRVRSRETAAAMVGPDSPAKRRQDACLLEPELAPALDVFSALTNEPEHVSVPEVVSACQTIVVWAEQKGFAETAMQFAEAAAAAAPTSAAIANLAGRLCRMYGKRGRAELWYDRAIGLARRTPGKVGVREYIHAHLGFATTLLEIEAHGRALKYIKRAGLMAKRKGMRSKAAEAFHDMLALSTLDGQNARAAIYARRAFTLYPYHHKRFPAFAYDLGFLLVAMGMYGRALSLLQCVVRKVTTGPDALVIWGTLARAAAGAGLAGKYYAAVRVVEQMIETYRSNAPAALYSLAEGARLLSEWEIAERYASRAYQVAQEVGSVQIIRRARRLLTEIEKRAPGTPPLGANDPRARIARRLATAVRMRLAKWRGATWRPRRDSDDVVG